MLKKESETQSLILHFKFYPAVSVSKFYSNLLCLSYIKNLHFTLFFYP